MPARLPSLAAGTLRAPVATSVVCLQMFGLHTGARPLPASLLTRSRRPRVRKAVTFILGANSLTPLARLNQIH